MQVREEGVTRGDANPKETKKHFIEERKRKFEEKKIHLVFDRNTKEI